MSLHESQSASDDDERAEKSAPPRSARDGLVVEQVFSSPHEHPFDQITWEKRTPRITDDKGEVVFEQEGVEVPEGWSQLATNVVTSKYFYGDMESDQREHSVRGLVDRVARTIADWGKQDGVFASDDDAERYYRELCYLCVNQYGAFNSPVWFNVGLYHQSGVAGSPGNFHWDAPSGQPVRTQRSYEYPQASACFIQSVDDTMEDIMRLATQEAMLFKYGSGTGSDLSTLRSSRERLAGGGKPSGPLSFMRVFDQIAAVVKSGGKTRRAAKMQSLRCDHPDIEEFITCKANEERKAWALIGAGYDGSFNGDAYASVMYQNANLSVRVTDEFMQAVDDDGQWQTYAVTTGEPMVQYRARALAESIADGTWVCGDPGLQYHSTINRWHTCSASGEICASNPCSEYMFVNDSACNLASLNLMKFRRKDGSFDIVGFRAAIRIFIIAQEILVDHASYPSERICRNSHKFRPLGLGYANLGSLVMSLGLPYDSDRGRAVAAAVTAVLTGTAYATSAELASRLDTFSEFHKNRDSMLNVMGMHRAEVDKISTEHCPPPLLEAAALCWDEAISAGRRQGYRNAQASVLAPTGTIGFMMDCDTTGIEPDIALVKYKQLAGGGMLKIVNRTVPQALEELGYAREQISDILEHIDKNDMIEDAPHLSDEHLAVFDCAFKPAAGQRCIHYMGHIRMMSAVQPFISGAISKTVNMPKETTRQEILDAYTEAWRLGLKAIAVYRDGSKRVQPVNTSIDSEAQEDREEDGMLRISAEQLEEAKRRPHRQRLPATRPSVTHKFDIAGHEGYLNVGLYNDKTPGELFITMAKEGSTVGGMMDAFATAISLCLQYGVPPEALVKKFTHQRFEPSGMTGNRDIPFAKSIVDYIFRWIGLEFLEEYREANLPKRGQTEPKTKPSPPSPASPSPSSETSISAAPEAVTEGAPSEPGRADRASDMEVMRPGGALSGGQYATVSPAVSVGGQIATVPGTSRMPIKLDRLDHQYAHFQEDAPPCGKCGSIMVRNGSCYVCRSCGTTSGCS